ncbi:MAG: hypothetical protein COT16_02775 [Elusimicrobia bacterium CG08_land_8_20_14_0_20_44_26]|nr:MAG: hypothetical protein COT16_02775 [Elusimicrobia bacterium CG08_land_8_20_14_0_20_44_26]
MKMEDGREIPLNPKSPLTPDKSPLAPLKSPLTPLLQRGESLFQRGKFPFSKGENRNPLLLPTNLPWPLFFKEGKSFYKGGSMRKEKSDRL